MDIGAIFGVLEKSLDLILKFKSDGPNLKQKELNALYKLRLELKNHLNRPKENWDFPVIMNTIDLLDNEMERLLGNI